jgi:eukaryotic-like serine/threonine-protein kinase
MSDDTPASRRLEPLTDVKLHSDLLSVATTAQQMVPDLQQRSLSKISVPPPAGRLIPGYQLGRYELLCPIARGGMASVWVARLQGAHGFEKLVALKTILAEHAADPAYEAMFLDEARIVASIRHQNVAEILDLGSADNLLYLVMEWVEGDSLALLDRAAQRHQAPIPMTVAMRIVAQMCAGLHAAHELADRNGKALNVVHRDVSPQNVIVSATGEVKLIDFGIAKAVDQLSEHTRTGVLKGKISFMSPEQALGQRVDRRADVWAAGVVLYQLLAGRLPFRGENQLETLHLISRKERAPVVPGLPGPVAKLLERVLEPELERRISSAAELEVELERLIGLLGPVTMRDVAGVVQKHLGRRMVARRTVVDTALRAADERIKLSQTFNAALEQDRLANEDSSAIAQRQQLTTALERVEIPKAPAAPRLDFLSQPPLSTPEEAVVLAMPKLLRRRPWLAPAALIATALAVIAALPAQKPASGEAAPAPLPRAAPARATSEPVVASPEVEKTPSQPTETRPIEAATTPSARPASSTKARVVRTPARRRVAPVVPTKPDVLEAFSERR